MPKNKKTLHDQATLTPASNAHTTSRFNMERFYLPMQDKVTNASSKEPLQLPKWEPARRGADDFRRFKSFGAGC